MNFFNVHIYIGGQKHKNQISLNTAQGALTHGFHNPT